MTWPGVSGRRLLRLWLCSAPVAQGVEQEVPRCCHSVEFRLVHDLAVFISRKDPKFIQPIAARLEDFQPACAEPGPHRIDTGLAAIIGFLHIQYETAVDLKQFLAVDLTAGVARRLRVPLEFLPRAAATEDYAPRFSHRGCCEPSGRAAAVAQPWPLRAEKVQGYSERYFYPGTESRRAGRAKPHPWNDGSKEGRDPLASKGLLRHSSLATTDRHYIKDVPENTP